MTQYTKFILVATLTVLVCGSFFIPGPSESDTEQTVSSWKSEVLDLAQSDRHVLRSAGAFTK
jgi:hypothetical protein